VADGPIDFREGQQLQLIQVRAFDAVGLGGRRWAWPIIRLVLFEM